jgi:hypothetical protein
LHLNFLFYLFGCFIDVALSVSDCALFSIHLKDGNNVYCHKTKYTLQSYFHFPIWKLYRRCSLRILYGSITCVCLLYDGWQYLNNICTLFRGTRGYPQLLVSSLCSIFSFLYNVLLAIDWPFVFVSSFLWPLYCLSLDLLLLIAPLLSSTFSYVTSFTFCIRRVWRYQREVIRIRISKKNRQHNGQKKSTKGQTTIYKTYT